MPAEALEPGAVSALVHAGDERARTRLSPPLKWVVGAALPVRGGLPIRSRIGTRDRGGKSRSRPETRGGSEIR